MMVRGDLSWAREASMRVMNMVCGIWEEEGLSLENPPKTQSDGRFWKNTELKCAPVSFWATWMCIASRRGLRHTGFRWHSKCSWILHKFIMRSRINATKRSEEHTSELQSQSNLVCRLLLEKN